MHDLVRMSRLMTTALRRAATATVLAAAALALARMVVTPSKEKLEIRTGADASRVRAALAAFVASRAWREGYAPAWVMRWWWCGAFEGSVSTILHHVARTPLAERPFRTAYARELVRTRDGGQIGLDWHRARDRAASELAATAPVVIVQHGLTGSSESTYVRHAVPRLLAAGFRVVVLVARGCGGVELRTPSGFTAHRTDDHRDAVEHVQRKYPRAPLFGVGYSLGAGLLLKYLGEEGAASPLRGAVAVSPSFDFHIKPAHFELWSRYRLVDGLKEWARKNRERLAHPKLDFERVLASVDVREFDTHAVVPVYGFSSVDEYYEASSAIRVAHDITTPTLALCAADDPVCSADGVPRLPEAFGPGLAVLVTRRGGHVGFASGFWGTESFMDDVVEDFLKACREAEAAP